MDFQVKKEQKCDEGSYSLNRDFNVQVINIYCYCSVERENSKSNTGVLNRECNLQHISHFSSTVRTSDIIIIEINDTNFVHSVFTQWVACDFSNVYPCYSLRKPIRRNLQILFPMINVLTTRVKCLQMYIMSIKSVTCRSKRNYLYLSVPVARVCKEPDSVPMQCIATKCNPKSSR